MGVGTPFKAAAALSLAFALSACGNSGRNQAPPPAQVSVVEIQPQPNELKVTMAGRVSAYQTSDVRPQIGGIVRSRLFREGATVRAGQVLYEIDAGPARAEVASAQADAISSRTRYERYSRLLEIDAVSQQEYDDARAAAEAADARLATARITLGYSRVTAPISGIIGASSVTPGALATPSQAEPFAVIQQIDRVYVDMSLSSGDLLRLRNQMVARGMSPNRPPVRLTLQDGSAYPITGAGQFADITVGESTGTVQVRALFNNPNRTLLPGMFVTTETSLGVDPEAILVPQRAVSRNARGEAVVMLLNAEGIVEERVIETAATSGDQWVVDSGLNPGDRVIVEGGQRVRAGAPATVAPPPAATEQQTAPSAPAQQER